MTDDYSKPVAYDAQGRPLYAHPPAQQLTSDPSESSHVTAVPPSQPGHNFDPRTRVQYANEPGVRHVAREINPPELPVSDKNKKKCDDSKIKYPSLNLSDGEYVITAVRRHPIGLFLPIAGTILAFVAIYGFAGVYQTMSTTGTESSLPASGDIWLIAILLSLLVAVFGYIATWIYLQNKFFMTNESVIQEIQHSLFAKHEQTVSLGSIEDASYKQSNILQMLFDYGTIRLSTEGEETTYRFHYVSRPKMQIARLNNAIEAFKNGRPVEDDMS